MQPAPLPVTEKERLERLRNYKVLDTPSEAAFDRITRVVAETIGVPIALVSLVDEDRQWFKAKYGLDAEETPRDVAFCAHAILDDKVFVVEDALKDQRFADNPLVTGGPSVRFYAGAPLITSDGHNIGTLCAIDHAPRQISEDHKLLLEDLATLVIDEMELRDALRKAVKEREAAELAERAKSQFLASMSHEIRTPLNAIIGLTELVLKTELNEQQEGHLFRVSLAGKNLLGLINDILDFSKIEAGKLEIETVDFEINDVLANLASVVSAKSEENQTELLINIDSSTPPAMRGDPLRIGQVLINLVGNAVKFTKSGDVTISVGAEHDQDGLGWLVLSVKDTGIGMSAAQCEDLFKPFTQADQSITREYGGTGLGLSISKQLVDLMGGTIWAESAEGKGSTFSFRLPLVVAKSTRTRREVFGIDPRTIRILIVDDNEAARELLKMALDKMRFEVETAKSGMEAIDKVSLASADGRSFDLLLVDWKMPEMDGVETIRKIRQIKTAGQLQTIFMVSVLEVDEIIGDLEKLDVAHFLQKPINTSFLFDKMMEVFNDDGGVALSKRVPLADVPSAKALNQDAILLLVEDNELNQMVATGVLENGGYTVELAENGKEAVELLRERGEEYFATILMDIQMPEMDGLTATKIIRKDLGFSRIPILAMTAHALSEERDRCLEAGMNDHLTKPIDARALISKLDNWVNWTSDSQPISSEPARHGDYFNYDEVKNRLGLSEEAIDVFLKKFIDKYSHADNEIVQLIKQSKHDDAADLVHAMRGVAGSIGAGKLAKILEVAEDQLRNGRADDALDLASEVSQILRDTVAKIEHVVR